MPGRPGRYPGALRRQDPSRQGGKRNSDLAKALERAVEWYHELLLRAPEGARPGPI